MKEKIFNALKQEYKSFGLSDEILRDMPVHLPQPGL